VSMPVSAAANCAAAEREAVLAGIDTDRRTQAGAPGLHPAAAKVLATLDLDRGVGVGRTGAGRNGGSSEWAQPVLRTQWPRPLLSSAR